MNNAGLTAHCCDFGGLSAQDLDQWRRIMGQHPALQRGFMGPDYVGASAATQGPVCVLVLRDPRGLARAFLPLSRMAGWAGRLGIYTVAGHEMSDYFGLIAEAGLKIDPQEMLRQSRGKVNCVLYHHLDETQREFGLVAPVYRKGLRTHVPSEGPSYWALLGAENKKLTSDTERRERKLSKDLGTISFTWQSRTPQEDLNWLIDKKCAQYSRTGKEAAPLTKPGNIALLKQLLRQGDAGESQIQLSTLRAGDQIVAAHLGLRHGNMLHVWFPVYEPSLASYSPGRILFKHMFEHGRIQGVTVFDRGEGDTPAKRDFANETHEFGKGTWVSPTWRGHLAHNWLRLQWRLASLGQG